MREFSCRCCGEAVEGITGMVTHPCDVLLRAADLNQREQSTLLYVHTRMVDHRGFLNGDHLNYEDFQNIKLFQAAGVFRVEELVITEFTNQAWRLIAECSQLRAMRMINRDIDLGRPPEGCRE